MTTHEMTDAEENARMLADEPAEPTPVVFIIGAGVVGTALAFRLTRFGVPVAGLHGRKTELSEHAAAVSGVMGTTGELPQILGESDVIIVSVRDERIPQIAEQLVREKRLSKRQILLHTSGAHPAAKVLGAARAHVRGIGTLHPLMSFTDPHVGAEAMRGAAFAIEGDKAAQHAAVRLVKSVGGMPLFLEAGNMALYHAGAVVASNYVVALADVARAILVEAGVPAPAALHALVPLMASVVRNLADVGLPDGLTGPVARGDVGTVERHLEALAGRVPGALDIYRRLGAEVLRIARDKGGPSAEEERRMGGLFGGAPTARPAGSPSPKTAARAPGKSSGASAPAEGEAPASGAARRKARPSRQP